MNDSSRFWNKVDVRNKNECWNWKAAIDTPGYGAFKLNRKKINSNIAAWILTYGDNRNGLYVLHTCDNRLCCNPNHLFLGTCLENISDMVNKDRQAKGESAGQCKFSDKDVAKIRELHEKKVPFILIQKEFNISSSHFYRIINLESR